ncbi:MAG: ABC transporter ATP-binding protein [Bdellovibrionales bacterium]|nr:ABC transporter ATP-binding protein [Bdellovibrionales bacterium]
MSIKSQSLSIQLKDVHKSFRDGRDKILRGLNLEVKAGELTYILGPSGVGKSVTLKHILGLIRPDRGSVIVGDKDVTQLNRDELVEHRMNFGMLFQNSALFDDLTIFENVAFPLREHTKLSEKEIKSKVTHALESLGMPTGHDKLPSEISGGMKKRVALARAIIREPKILLYDEPTTGLDPVTRTMVDELIGHLKDRFHLTSLVISHDIPSALLLADQIAFLYQGAIVFYGTAAEFRKCNHEAVRSFLNAEKRTVEALNA